MDDAIAKNQFNKSRAISDDLKILINKYLIHLKKALTMVIEIN